MERNQFWLFFGFALLLGLAAAAYQHAEGLNLGAPMFHSHLDDEGPMYSGNDHVHLKTGYDGNSSFAKIAGFVSRLPIHLGNGENAKKPDAKTAAKTDTKKKKDDKKKKKKDQAKIAPGITAPISADNKSGQPQEPTGKDGSGAIAPASGSNSAAGGASAADNGIPKTLEEWVKYILTTPDTTRTQFMIQMYQSRLLTADIFFQVMNLMVNDTRDQMRALGVLAAGASPSSNSFHTLLNLANSTSEVSNVRGQATTYLRTYAQLPNIGFLMSVMTENTSPTSVAVALNLLQLAGKPYTTTITAANATTGSTNGTTNGTTTGGTTGTTVPSTSVANVRAQMAAYQAQLQAASRQLYINEQAAQGQEQIYNENGQIVNSYNESSTAVGANGALDTTTPSNTVTLTAQQKKLNKYFQPFVTVVTGLVKSGSTSGIRTSATTALAMLNKIITPTTTTITPTTPTLPLTSAAAVNQAVAYQMGLQRAAFENSGR